MVLVFVTEVQLMRTNATVSFSLNPYSAQLFNQTYNPKLVGNTDNRSFYIHQILKFSCSTT